MILFLIIYQQYFLPKSVEVDISSLGKNNTQTKVFVNQKFLFLLSASSWRALDVISRAFKTSFCHQTLPLWPHYCRGFECWCSKTSLNQQLCSRPKWGLSGHSSIPTANSHNLFNVSNIFSWKIFSYSVIYFCLFWACIIIQDST